MLKCENISILTMDPISFPKIPDSPEENGCNDWTYAMRRDMQEMVPGLYLGPYAAAMKSKLAVLQGYGITHIVCIRHTLESHFIKPNFQDYFRYLVLDVADTVTENIIRILPKVRDFIEECFAKKGKVLIHGNAGISRSATLVIAYIMEQYGLSYMDAFSYVQQRRFCINPNQGFAQQLREYEPIYKANLSLRNGHSSQGNGLLKRKYEQDDESMDTDSSSHMKLT
ncbi:unnamed protein product [Owenia fusiformis]|uniref:Uncharacterized protein n=1 Tax=Owenia fusiformis TaxID=6347 RepID=A0A8J1Y5Y1_OWEFU|nr:unnamed protein product [Owenia fusiformis]